MINTFPFPSVTHTHTQSLTEGVQAASGAWCPQAGPDSSAAPPHPASWVYSIWLILLRCFIRLLPKGFLVLDGSKWAIVQVPDSGDRPGGLRLGPLSFSWLLPSLCDVPQSQPFTTGPASCCRLSPAQTPQTGGQVLLRPTVPFTPGSSAVPAAEAMHYASCCRAWEGVCPPLLRDPGALIPAALREIRCFQAVELDRVSAEGQSFPSSSAGKEYACHAGDPGSSPGSGRSPGEGVGYPLQHSCLKNAQGQGSLAGYGPRGTTERQGAHS